MPTALHIRLIDIATQTAAIAISRQRAEAALRESEARTRLLIKSSNIGLWDRNLLTNEVFFSPEWKSQLGYADDEVPGRYEEWENRLHPEDREPSLRAVQDFREGRRQDYDVEFRLRHKDGSWRSILARADLIRDAAGQPVRMLGCHIDLTERKQAEETLREVHERLGTIIEKAPLAIVAIDSAAIVQMWNPAAERLFGWTMSELVGRSILPLIPKEERRQFEELIAGESKGVVRDGQELRRLRKDGSLVDVSVWTAPLYNAQNEIARTIGMFADITRRKQAEEALRESEERFRTIFEQAPLGISEGEIATARFVSANQHYADILGYTLDELRALTFKDYTHPEDLQKDLDQFQKLAAGEIRTYAMEKRYIRKDGAIIWVNLTVSGLARPSEKPLNCMAIIEDITDRKRAQKALNAQALRYKTLMETSTDSIYVTDEKGDLQEANAAFLRRRGYTASEVKGLSVADWDAQWSREQLRERLRKLVGSSAVFETRHRCKDGSVFDVEVCVTSVRIGGEQLFFAVTRDITERKQAEDRLRRSEEKFKALFGIAPVGISVLDRQHNIVDANPALEQITRLAKKELLNGTYRRRTYLNADGTPKPPSELASERAVTENRPIHDVETGIVTENGEIIWTQVSVAPLALPDASAVVITQDITESKRAVEALKTSYEQLRAVSARLQSVREEEATRIAREIHDDLGQKLTGLKMDLLRAERKLEELESSPAVNTVLDTIVSATELADAIIAAVQEIAANLRPGVLDKLGPGAALQYEARRFQERSGVLCEARLPETEPNLSTEVSTTLFRIFQECLTNITRHAHATKVEASLKLEDGPAAAEREHAGWVILRVQDNGPGITEAAIANPESLGLLGMKERTALLGGEIVFQRGAEGGTIVTARLPQGGTFVQTKGPV